MWRQWKRAVAYSQVVRAVPSVQIRKLRAQSLDQRKELSAAVTVSAQLRAALEVKGELVRDAARCAGYRAAGLAGGMHSCTRHADACTSWTRCPKSWSRCAPRVARAVECDAAAGLALEQEQAARHP